jgi:hypothetical protein
MANRDRGISQSLALCVGPTPSTGAHAGGSVKQLERIQSIGYDFRRTLTDIQQMGNLAAIGREPIEPPTVSLNFSFNDVGGDNLQNLGFTVDGSVSCISGIINDVSDDKNYFIVRTPEGQDANDNTGVANANFETVGLGNVFISNLTFRGAVGSPPTTDISAEALNMNFSANRTGINIPAVDDTGAIVAVTCDMPTLASGDGPTALRPGDITVDINNAVLGVTIADLKIQNYEIAMNLSRTPLNKLGSRAPFARKINFPASATASVTADMGDLGTGNLAILNCENPDYDITVTIREPGCGAELGAVAEIITLKGAKLDAQNHTHSLNGNDSVVLNFGTQMGASSDLLKGVFYSGKINA